jgi:hypothetical protein
MTGEIVVLVVRLEIEQVVAVVESQPVPQLETTVPGGRVAVSRIAVPSTYAPESVPPATLPFHVPLMAPESAAMVTESLL